MAISDTLLDLDLLHVLQRDLGRADVLDILIMFDEEMLPVLSGLQDGSPTLGDDLHSLRGAASALGMIAVTARTLELEAQARSGESTDPSDLQGLVDRSMAEIRRILGQPGGQIKNSASVSSSVMSR